LAQAVEGAQRIRRLDDALEQGAMAETFVEALAQMAVENKKSINADTVEVAAPYLKETKSWIYFAEPVGPGGAKWVRKNHVISYDVEEGAVKMKMLIKKAKEQGLM
jgi:hypothetical protein